MKKGFSILELVIVVIMLGIIASFAIPSVSGLSEERNVKTTASDLALYIDKIRTCANATGIPVKLTLGKDGSVTSICCSECATLDSDGFCTKCVVGKDVRSKFAPTLFDDNANQKFAGNSTGVSDSNIIFKYLHKTWGATGMTASGSYTIASKASILFRPAKLMDYTTQGTAANYKLNRIVLTDDKAGEFSCTIDISSLGLAEVACE